MQINIVSVSGITKHSLAKNRIGGALRGKNGFQSDQLKAIFKAIGIRHLITVEKIRRTYTFESSIEIALDTVVNLGHFIEIEYKGDASIESANEKIRQFAEFLGVSAHNRDHRGYPYLMLEKAGLIKEIYDSQNR